MKKKQYQKPMSKVAPFAMREMFLNNGSNTNFGNTESLIQSLSLEETEFTYDTDNF